MLNRISKAAALQSSTNPPIVIKRKVSINVSQEPTFFVNTTGDYSVTKLESNIYQVTLTFKSQSQITGTETLTAITAEGCTKSINLDLEGFCDSFHVSQIITDKSEYERSGYTIYSLDSNEEFSVDWALENEAKFSFALQGDKAIKIKQLDGTNVTSTLRATAISENGCTHYREIDIIPCRVVASDVNVSLSINGRGYQSASLVSLSATSSCNSGIDWSTLIIENNSKVRITAQDKNKLDLEADFFLSSTERMYYTVKDSNGILSNRATISIRSTGTLGTPASVPPITIPVDCDASSVRVCFSSLKLPTDVDTGSISVNEALTNVSSHQLVACGIEVAVGDAKISSLGINARTKDGKDIDPIIVGLVKKLCDYTEADQEVIFTCTNEKMVNLANYGNISRVKQLISGEAKLESDTVLSYSKGNSPVIVKVENSQGQTTDMRLNVCGICVEDKAFTSCESVFTLYDLLGPLARPNGKWELESLVTASVIGGATPVQVLGGADRGQVLGRVRNDVFTSDRANFGAVTGFFQALESATVSESLGELPNSYNGKVSIPELGKYTYVYYSPNQVGEYECEHKTAHRVIINRVGASEAPGNNCSTSKELKLEASTGYRSEVQIISKDCDRKNSFSGKTGYQAVHKYDAWFKLKSDFVPYFPETAEVSIQLSGSGKDGLRFSKIQIWDSCGVPTTELSYRHTEFNSTVKIPFNKIKDSIVQVLSDVEGTFVITVIYLVPVSNESTFTEF